MQSELAAGEPPVDHDEKRLVLAIETNERLRARARAVATLIAAAAAALAATVVLTPDTFAPPWALIFGAAAVVALVVSTCAFIAASLSYTGSRYIESPFGRLVLTLAMFWRVHPHVRTRTPSTADLVSAASSVQSRITQIVNVAMWIAGLGVVGFACCLAITAFDRSVEVRVTTSDVTAITRACPDFVQAFPATVARNDLSSTSSLVALHLKSDACGAERDVLVFVDRAATTLTSEAGY